MSCKFNGRKNLHYEILCSIYHISLYFEMLHVPFNWHHVGQMKLEVWCGTLINIKGHDDLPMWIHFFYISCHRKEDSTTLFHLLISKALSRTITPSSEVLMARVEKFNMYSNDSSYASRFVSVKGMLINKFLSMFCFEKEKLLC